MPKQVIIPPGTRYADCPPLFQGRSPTEWYMSPALCRSISKTMCSTRRPKGANPSRAGDYQKRYRNGGGSMADVTFNSIFIPDWQNYAAINEVYAEFSR